MTFSFGQSERERIEAEVFGYERQRVGEYWDDNWLTVEIRVQAGRFRGNARAAFITDDLVGFVSQLRPLYETLSGSAEFKTMEGQLSMRLVGDGKGHIDLTGEVSDRKGGFGNHLRFTLQFDQSQLGASIRELERVISEFPVRVA
jgi:hypothetical protein